MWTTASALWTPVGSATDCTEIYDCGCTDIPAGDCDCDGNQLDALGVCGGACTADVDADGICDDVDDCVGALDACGVCNGPGEIYDCGCGHERRRRDCDGNSSTPWASVVEHCSADADADGICDDVDDCVGTWTPAECAMDRVPSTIAGVQTFLRGPDCAGNVLDECGTCGGSGIPAGDCDCNGNRWTRWGSVAAIARPTMTAMASVTFSKDPAVRIPRPATLIPSRSRWTQGPSRITAC